MDDFRVGSVPSSEPYGDRHPYNSVARKRPKHHDDEQSGQQDEPADTFEAKSEEPSNSPDKAEDYYLPSEPAESE